MQSSRPRFGSLLGLRNGLSRGKADLRGYTADDGLPAELAALDREEAGNGNFSILRLAANVSLHCVRGVSLLVLAHALLAVDPPTLLSRAPRLGDSIHAALQVACPVSTWQQCDYLDWYEQNTIFGILNSVILDPFHPNYEICAGIASALEEFLSSYDGYTFVTHDVGNFVMGSTEDGQFAIKRSLFQLENQHDLRGTVLHEAAHLAGYNHASGIPDWAEENC